ncbi:Mis12-Mtw1 protein family-domain-containing protein [Pyrenochaeta sp. MPI-SDFR-AT-0127]|nr:Mis12-Mtw1 protein family-domain-containing protein [Pyrenochaeta sp. MPI-SDFR-AT-0127]
MTAIFARSPLQSLPMATNRPTTRRRSVKQAFEDDDAPAPKRPKTEVNGLSKRATGTTKKAAAAKAAYEETDDGFQFSRRTSRRTAKAQAPPAPEPIPEDEAARPLRTADALPAKPTSRRKKTSIAAIDLEPSDAQKRRRSTRLSGDREQLEVRPKVTEPLAAKRTKKSAPVEKERKKQVTPAPETQPEDKSAFKGLQTPTYNELQVSKKRDPNAQRIMLPFADTPVITRNKEMRKGNKDGHRRSSTGLRGRRASSLIDSGMSNALPHSEVEVRDFYKYIEQSLPEPRRMKQLLTWSGSRALPEKPSGDVKNANAIMAARAIQQELIDDFASRPELSDWFSREETAPRAVIRKPNPQNEKNKITLQELEAEVNRLEEEKAAWEALASSSTTMPPPPAPSINGPTPTFSDIDTSLLDPAQAAILSSLQPLQQPQPQTRPPTSAFTFTSPTALQAHLTTLSDSLEPHIDLFADGVHKIEQYRQTAERVADRVLGSASRRLEERDREVKERVGAGGIGVGDVLRGLAGVLGE